MKNENNVYKTELEFNKVNDHDQGSRHERIEIGNLGRQYDSLTKKKRYQKKALRRSK